MLKQHLIINASDTGRPLWQYTWLLGCFGGKFKTQKVDTARRFPYVGQCSLQEFCKSAGVQKVPSRSKET